MNLIIAGFQFGGRLADHTIGDKRAMFKHLPAFVAGWPNWLLYIPWSPGSESFSVETKSLPTEDTEETEGTENCLRNSPFLCVLRVLMVSVYATCGETECGLFEFHPNSIHDRSAHQVANPRLRWHNLGDITEFDTSAAKGG